MENKLNVANLDDVEGGTYLRFFYSRNKNDYYISFTCYLKFKGIITSKNLPIRIISSVGFSTSTLNYSYTLDPDGYPIEIFLKQSEDGEYGYEEETMKYIITYY